jgi:protein TonB
MPRFKGGLEGFKNFVLEKLNYPETAKMNDEEGSVQIRFTVGRDGNIKGISLVKQDKEYFNEQVIQAVASSPKWIPGKRDGKLVDVTITLPVKFRLK